MATTGALPAASPPRLQWRRQPRRWTRHPAMRRVQQRRRGGQPGAHGGGRPEPARQCCMSSALHCAAVCTRARECELQKHWTGRVGRATCLGRFCATQARVSAGHEALPDTCAGTWQACLCRLTAPSGTGCRPGASGAPPRAGAGQTPPAAGRAPSRRGSVRQASASWPAPHRPSQAHAGGPHAPARTFIRSRLRSCSSSMRSSMESAAVYLLRLERAGSSGAVGLM